MTDHFATLALPRRPWLEADVVKEAFHRLSATLHPDVPGTGDAARFAALNAAHSILREPAARLRHLLELTAPDALSANAPPPSDLGDLFMQIAGLRRRFDALLAQRKASPSPLTSALLAGDEAALRREFAATHAQLVATENAALEELRRLDAAWIEDGAAAPVPLAALAHRLTYLARWLAQTCEALFTLGAGK